MISVSGNYSKTTKFLTNAKQLKVDRILNAYARRGVDALASATPYDTGLTAHSWNYQIEKTNSGYRIVWTNSNVQDGVNIAVILQYGHGTGTGGYVPGRDYINPALRPVFDALAKDLWKEVSSL